MQSIIKKSMFLLLAMMLATAAFGLTVQTASAVTGPTSLSLKVASGTGYSAVVDVNGKVKVYVSSVYPFSASKSCYWSVYSGSTYGKISSKYNTYCYVQGVKAGGTVTIKAKSKYYPYVTRYIKVYVKQLYPTGVKLNKSVDNLWTGTTDTLAATVVKSSWVYSAGVSWASSDTNVATVSTSGKVTPVGAGTATITATSKDKSTLKASCVVNVYHAALDQTGKIAVNKGDTLENPVDVTGPDGEMIYGLTFTSSNTDAATVDPKSGTVEALGDGSAVITATVNLPIISLTTKTKTLTYTVNVRNPEGSDGMTFLLPSTWSTLEINHSTNGFAGDRSLLLNKTMLDDFFGVGSLGIDLFNPLDMALNFMGQDFLWDAGGFVFDKTGNDVEIAAMKDGIPFYGPYFLYNAGTADDSLLLTEDSEGVLSGYDLRFYHEAANPAAGYANVNLTGNVLTVPFAGEDLAIKRVAANKVQIMADADMGGTPDDVVLTIVRTIAGHFITVNDVDYMTAKGITFYTYKSYL